MGALAAAVHPFAGGVPRLAAPAPCDASERAPGKMPWRVAPARDSSVCLAGVVEELYVPSHKRKMACNHRNNVEAAADTKVLTAGGEMSARELLQKRLASELHALRGLLKKAELISRRRGECKGGAGAPAAGGKKERFLASKQRSEPMVDGGGNAPSVKRRKISTLVDHKQKQKQKRAPGMSAEERNHLAGRLSSLSGELPGHIVEFLQRQFGDADSRGEIEIDIDCVEDSVLFELKTQLDKFAEERPTVVVDVLPVPVPDEKGEKLAEESKSKGILEQEVKTGSRPSSRRSSSGSHTGGANSACERYSDEFPALRGALALPEQITATSAQPPPSSEPASGAAAQRSGEAKKAQDVLQRAAPKAVPMAALIYRANLRRQLLEMERAALPDQSIHPRDLQRLGIAEYGHPSLMRQLGLVLKADDA